MGCVVARLHDHVTRVGACGMCRECVVSVAQVGECLGLRPTTTGRRSDAWSSTERRSFNPVRMTPARFSRESLRLRVNLGMK